MSANTARFTSRGGFASTSPPRPLRSGRRHGRSRSGRSPASSASPPRDWPLPGWPAHRRRCSRDGAPERAVLSLSHHGRLVAFACVLDEPQASPMTVLPTFHRVAIVNRGDAAMRCSAPSRRCARAKAPSSGDRALHRRRSRRAVRAPRRRAVAAARAARRGRAPISITTALLAALRQAGADAVWPGWGFVAEDPEFVDRFADAGMSLPRAVRRPMRALGDKIAAKELAERAGVPVAAWSGAARRGRARAAHRRSASASAAGEGVGRRRRPRHPRRRGRRGARRRIRGAGREARRGVRRRAHLPGEMCAAGATSRCRSPPTQHGFVVALGCRDCSVQRRHQKVIEEAPPPGLAPSAARAARRAAAVRVARRSATPASAPSSSWSQDGGHFFLEMNPRLQVEHGITEEITGLDLVELQIRIARGEPLRRRAAPQRGVCIEARVCAEDPDAGFLPAPGRIARFDPALGPHVRVDTGVVAGSAVPAAFDSLIAKVIATGDTREEARARLRRRARATSTWSSRAAPPTRATCIEVLETPDYRARRRRHAWLDRCDATQRKTRRDARRRGARAGGDPRVPARARRGAAQLLRRPRPRSRPTSVPPLGGRSSISTIGGVGYRAARVLALGSWRYRVHFDGRAISARFARRRARRAPRASAAARCASATTSPTRRCASSSRAARIASAGRPSARCAPARRRWSSRSTSTPGDRVDGRPALGLLEAMKMEIGFTAPVAGVVSEVRVAPGQQVAAGDVLLVIDPADGRRARCGRRAPRCAGGGRSARAAFAPAAGRELDTPDLPRRSAPSCAARARRRSATSARARLRRRSQRAREAARVPGRCRGSRRSCASEPARAARASSCCSSTSSSCSIRTPRRVGAGDARAVEQRAPAHLPAAHARQGAGIAEEFLAMLRAALRTTA